jgi:hypothetical protein
MFEEDPLSEEYYKEYYLWNNVQQSIQMT